MGGVKLEKYLVPFVFISVALFYLSVWYFSDGYYGGTDNINHYFLARYSFQHPEFFFDGWGRPLFTILSSPFAQFGFKGIQFFNLILSLLTLGFGYLTARRLNYSNPVLAIVMTGFTPIFYILIFTGLTEILAGFLLILSVYLFFRGNNISSAVVISLIYFARSEAMIFYPLFLAAYLFKKQYRAVPFLLTGAIIFTVIGGLYFNDFLWLLHKFPYPVHHKIYTQKGPLFHFVRQGEYIFGVPLEILLIAGSLVLITQLPLKKETLRQQSFYELLLILFPFAGFFAMHSILYWKALGGSVGLIRVITTVVPLSGLICLKGYNFLDRQLTPFPKARNIFRYALIAIIVATSLIIYRFPVANPYEKTLKKAAVWLKENPCSDRLFFYTDLTFPFYMEVDPNDRNRSAQVFDGRKLFLLPDSCVVVWDSHFGPNENEIPLDSLSKSRHFKLLKAFRHIEIDNYGKCIPYYAMIFLKVPCDDAMEKLHRLGWVLQEDEGSGMKERIYSNGFEMDATGLNTDKITGERTHSGMQAYRMDESSEFSPVFTMKWKFLSTGPDQVLVRYSLYVCPADAFSEEMPALVISLEDPVSPYSYTAKSLAAMRLPPNQWSLAQAETTLTPRNPLTDHFSIYVYNPGKKKFFIDDMKVELVPLTRPESNPENHPL